MIFATRILQLKCISLALVILFTIFFAGSASAQTAAGSLLIYQVQTGAPGSVAEEYVAIYNNSAQPAEITNWCVSYASASDATQTQLGCLKPPDNSNIKLFLSPYQPFLLATSEFEQGHSGFTADILFKAGIAATSGHIKLLDPSKIVVDSVGWGTAVQPEGSSVSAPAAGMILQRLADKDSLTLLQDTDNNSMDFYQTDLILPSTGHIYEEEADLVEECQSSDVNCRNNAGLVLSELLPDVAGADAGKEFIEIHNPTSHTVNLTGYTLQLGPGFTKTYMLPDGQLASNGYLAISDMQSKITLPNTTANIRLAGPDGSVVSEIMYSEVEEDVALSLIGGIWQKTYQPTPGFANILVAVKPCPAGQTRNPDSGQCKKTSLVVGAVACKPGQLRNPSTGRCRNIPAATVSTACKPGQQKNPATNRCRNIVIPTTAKPCPAGQERNAGTGRCRKITALAASGTNSVKDVPSALVSNSLKWWIIGAAAVGTAGYGLYEWRREVILLLSSFKNRFIQKRA